MSADKIVDSMIANAVAAVRAGFGGGVAPMMTNKRCMKAGCDESSFNVHTWPRNHQTPLLLLCDNHAVALVCQPEIRCIYLEQAVEIVRRDAAIMAGNVEGAADHATQIQKHEAAAIKAWNAWLAIPDPLGSPEGK